MECTLLHMKVAFGSYHPWIIGSRISYLITIIRQSGQHSNKRRKEIRARPTPPLPGLYQHEHTEVNAKGNLFWNRLNKGHMQRQKKREQKSQFRP